MPVDEERKKFVDFGNDYHLLQCTYLVAPGSTLMNVEDANTQGVRIGGVANTATFRAAQRTAPKATFVTVAGVDAAIAAIKAGEIDCIALSRESLTGLAAKIPGSRILDGGFLNSSTAVAVPKDRPDAFAYVSQFIEDAKASGSVRRSFDAMNLKNSRVAPAGMKPWTTRAMRQRPPIYPHLRSPPMADAAVSQQLTPTGKLRVAIAVAPAPSAQFAIKDAATGTYRGVAVILGRALAKKLGVEAQLIVHNGSGEVQNSAADNKWDVAFLPVDEERKKFVDFGNAYHILQSTYLVAPGAKFASVSDANKTGIRIGGVANTATFRTSNKTAPNAAHSAFEKADAAVAALRDGKLDAIAFSRESLTGLQANVPGSRILDGGFMNSTTSVAVPKGKPAALAYVSAFIEEAKASGLVRQAFDEMGLKSSQVAPAGMKS